MKLTVEIAAQQLQPESRSQLKVLWLNPDVAGNKWRSQAVVFHLRAVHVAVKYLKHAHTNMQTVKHISVP